MKYYVKMIKNKISSLQMNIARWSIIGGQMKWPGWVFQENSISHWIVLLHHPGSPMLTGIIEDMASIRKEYIFGTWLSGQERYATWGVVRYCTVYFVTSNERSVYVRTYAHVAHRLSKHPDLYTHSWVWRWPASPTSRHQTSPRLSGYSAPTSTALPRCNIPEARQGRRRLGHEKF